MALFAIPFMASASEADLVIPDGVKNETILYWGFLITLAGFLFGLYQFTNVKKKRAHQSMLDVAKVIYETGKTYLIQQGIETSRLITISYGEADPVDTGKNEEAYAKNRRVRFVLQ